MVRAFCHTFAHTSGAGVNMHKPTMALLLVGALAVAGALPAGAEPGDLDGSFGVCGARQAAQMVDNGSETVGGSAGRVYGVEEIQDPVRGTVRTISRRTAMGNLDQSWGDHGRAFLPPGAGIASMRGTVDHAGRFVFATSGGTSTLYRLTATGQLDTTFGGGQVQTPFTSIGRVLALADDSVVVDSDPTRSGPYTVYRYTPSGALDPGYPAATNPDAGALTHAVLALPDGGLLVDVGVDHTVVRWNADGSRDATFLPIVPLHLGPPSVSSVPDGVALGDGRFLLGFQYGARYFDPEDLVVVGRFLAGGAPDATFGLGGYSGVVGWATRSRSLQMSGTNVLVFTETSDGDNVLSRITRVNASGLLDRSWGANGTSGFPLRSSIVFGWGETLEATLVQVTTEIDLRDINLDARFSHRNLTAGAGLMLQWNGDAWPSRFGRDPGPECPFDTPYWSDWDIARGITTVTGKGGYIADGYGGIHPFSIGLQHPAPAVAKGGPYWPGWDITRGIAAKPDGTGGYVLDGFGGLHPFHTGSKANPPATVGGPYWPGWDITRGVALYPDGTRGYILDAYGGVHRFTTPGHPLPPKPTGTPYWPGWDIARGIGILPDGTGGYVVDAYGGTHPFGLGTHAPPPQPGPNDNYVPGQDWVRGYTFIAPTPPAVAGTSASTHGAVVGSTDTRRFVRQGRRPTPIGPSPSTTARRS